MGLYTFLAAGVFLLRVHQQPHQLLAVLDRLVIILAAASLVQQCGLVDALPPRGDATWVWVDRRLDISWLLRWDVAGLRRRPVLFVHLVYDVLILAGLAA